MSKASRLKGHCNRLIAINELPAHQREVPLGAFPFGFGGGIAHETFLFYYYFGFVRFFCSVLPH